MLAHGRDPYFPSWPDVVQLNAFSPEMRAVTVETLNAIAGQCDGIRCDMAMLLINRIFAKTWGDRAGPDPREEFWPEVVAALRGRTRTQCFSPRRTGTSSGSSSNRGSTAATTSGSTTGSSDEGSRRHPRSPHREPGLSVAAGAVPGKPRRTPCRAARCRPRERVAAVMIATLPGATLWHEGQFEGRRVRPPVFLRRRPDEPADRDLAQWYERLLAIPDIRTGTWRLLAVNGWPDNQSWRNLLAWSWSGADNARHVVVVNLSGQPAQGRIPLGWPDLPGRDWRLEDLLSGAVFVRDGGELAGLCSSPWSRGSTTSSHRGEPWRRHVWR